MIVLKQAFCITDTDVSLMLRLNCRLQLSGNLPMSPPVFLSQEEFTRLGQSCPHPSPAPANTQLNHKPLSHGSLNLKHSQ